ncbi:TIR domain-containing protein [Pseudoalteromonas piscicida]|uniref:TIR domain-containing protein n=1 Tax=Pseudoalteromonas piscicida TaxID=43662 RepID=UPI001EFEC122|nr:TIR domain-containing protein [Pseudoalteromonas piscicida]MCG9767590.1 TIR domain-containing protein [Pseudoalteromonas piscicida]
MTIFVSYTTRDSYVDRNTLEMVSDVLSNYGPHYIDLLHNDASEKQRHVEKMLSNAQLMILISSRSIEKSEWVQWELSEAKRSGIPIVTVQASMNQKETINNLKYKVASEFTKLTRRSSKDALTRAA